MRRLLITRFGFLSSNQHVPAPVVAGKRQASPCLICLQRPAAGVGVAGWLTTHTPFEGTCPRPSNRSAIVPRFKRVNRHLVHLLLASVPVLPDL